MPIPLGILAVAGAGVKGLYWFSYRVEAAANAGCLRELSDGKILVSRQNGTDPQNYENLIFSSSGAILSTSLADDFRVRPPMAAVDSSNNIYWVGGSDKDGNTAPLIVKTNSSLSTTWQKRITNVTGTNAYFSGVTLDSSNIYAAGRNIDSVTSSVDSLLVKYNTSGVVQWQKGLINNSSGGNEEWKSVTLDNSGNVIVIGEVENSGLGFFQTQIAKYTAAGVLSWQREYGNSASVNVPSYLSDIQKDSDGNLYAILYIRVGTQGGRDIALLKFDTSGNLTWQRAIGSATGDEPSTIAIDSSNNIYIGGFSGDNSFLVSYDSSGNVRWQRSITGMERITGMDISSDGSMLLYGPLFEGTDRVTLAKLPSDGSLTGTYTDGTVTYTYSAASLTAYTPTLTWQTSSLSEKTWTSAEGNSTLTFTSPSYTYTKLEI